MTAAAAEKKSIRSTVPARLDRLSAAPGHSGAGGTVTR